MSSILVDSLTEENTDPNQDTTIDLGTQAPAEEKPQGFKLPDKFVGKSAEEIAQSYIELERHQGTLANQLGEYRSMTDRFLSVEEKRLNDLESAQAEQASSFEIDATDLLADPERVLEEFYQSRRAKDEEFQALQQRLARIEGQVGQSALQQNHPDAVVVTNDPEFHNWLNSHPFRANLAQSAIADGNVDQLDYLLTEWKERNPGNNDQQTTQSPRQREVARAQALATETSSASGNTSTNSGKRYRRGDLVRLKMTDPDRYEEMGEEILLAYAQKRVDD